ncbi:MAG: hypothetical protein N2508_05685 [Anaerolineae bacterium]|nr:hypothetical protein [Anaerolineae bacterium]
MIDPLLARLVGLVIILLLCLLAIIFVEPAQASGVVSVAAEHHADGDVLALVTLALVGGVIVLAGGLWIGKLQHLLRR